MTFWIQHGYGKSNKIARLIETGLITGGVILSPGDEDPAALGETSTSIAKEDVRQLVDPQFYVHSILGARARCHESHDIDFGDVSWFLSPTDIADHVESLLRLNRALGMREYVAPAPYLAAFNDVWAPIGLQYSRAFVEASERPAFVSVIAEDTAFADWDATSRWLDAVTTIDAHGIYLIVSHSNASYPVTWDPNRLANVLRFIYALSELNGYEVIWAYSDIAGLAGLSAGAEGFGSGWYNSLRMWTPGKWMPQSGGHAANPRVLLAPLLSSLVAVGETQSVAKTALGVEIFEGTDLYQQFRRDDPNWGLPDSWYQHLQALATLSAAFSSNEPIANRVGQFGEVIANAIQLVEQLGEAGAAISPAHKSRLVALQRGLAKFVTDERI